MKTKNTLLVIIAMLSQVGMRAASSSSGSRDSVHATLDESIPNKREIQMLVDEQLELLMKRIPKSRMSAAIITTEDKLELISSFFYHPQNKDIREQVDRLAQILPKASSFQRIVPIAMMCLNNQPNVTGSVKILENPCLSLLGVGTVIPYEGSRVSLQLKIGEREVQMECLGFANNKPNGDCAHFKKTKTEWYTDFYEITAVLNSEEDGDTYLLYTTIGIEGDMVEQISREKIIPKYDPKDPIEAMRSILYIARSAHFHEFNTVFPVLGRRISLGRLLDDAIAQDPDTAYNLIIERTDPETMFRMGARNFFEALDTRQALQMVLNLLEKGRIESLRNLNFERKTRKIYSDNIKRIVRGFIDAHIGREDAIQLIGELTILEINRLNNLPPIPAPRGRIAR